jgi:hypothetical protein
MILRFLKFIPSNLKIVTNSSTSIVMSAEEFWSAGLHFFHPHHDQHGNQQLTVTGLRSSYGLFGVSPTICSIIWELLNEIHPQGAQPEHLLYALLFLKNYGTEEINSSVAGVSAKTFRKWCWQYINLIAFHLDLVSGRH